MSEIATYYVTLKPIREGAQPAFGWRNMAYVNDPAIEEVGVYLNAHDPRLVADELVTGVSSAIGVVKLVICGCSTTVDAAPTGISSATLVFNL